MTNAANLTEAQSWLEQAEFDLEASEASRAAGNFEWACFQAQQGAEKALKAYLYAAGRRAIVSHSIYSLLNECEALDPDFAAIREARELDQFYLPTRYPNSLQGTTPHHFFGEEHALRCQSPARSVIEFVKRSIAS